MRRRLTDLAVARLNDQGEVWDTLLPAFGLRVGARSKTWVVATRRPGARHPVRLRIGTYPALGVAEARAKAREMMAGGAPPAPTLFRDQIEPFLAHGRTRKGRPLRQASLRVYRTILNGTARPLHDKAIAEIRRRDIAELLAAVELGSGAAMASLTRSTLGRLWSWMLAVDRADASPVAGAPSYEVPKRSRVLSDAELRALWATTEEPAAYHTIVRLCVWTGARRGEVGGMRWGELYNGIWTIPATRTKNHRELVLPLPQQAVRELERAPRLDGRDLVFGRSGRRGFTNWSGAKATLDGPLRFNLPWSLHDLRRTVETRLAGLRVAKEVRSRILNHDVGAIEDAYQHHDFMVEKRLALQAWADALERIVS
jgi:integrase